MIPKIIHYCWLSNDPYPEKIKTCMASWKKHLHDYEFRLWNFDRFDINSSVWVKQAFEVRKYAFAADYIRLYALYNYGGIYLDTDVEVLKPFDDLLDLPYFLGEEFSNSIIEAATFGAEKDCYWIGECLKYYNGRKFEYAFEEYDMKPLPEIIRDIITVQYSLKHIKEKTEICRDEKCVYILPVDFFSPKKWDDPNVLNLTKNTYSVHHFAGSWLHGKEQNAERVRFLDKYGEDKYLVDWYNKFKRYEYELKQCEYKLSLYKDNLKIVPLKKLCWIVAKRTVKKLISFLK